MKKQRLHLTIDDRMEIQALLTNKNTITQIANYLGFNKSTISREISSNILIKKGSYPICYLKDRYGLCNGCLHKTCLKDRHFYNYRFSEIQSSNLRSISRSKSKLKVSDIVLIDQIIKDGVSLGQSLHHIYVSSPILHKICVERTIRRLCYRGNLSIKPHQLRRYVTYSHSYKKEPKEMQLRDIRVLIGRTYKDYKKVVTSHKSLNVVQFDSVIGTINDKRSILTITFPRYNFQFGILISKGSPGFVKGHIKTLFKNIGDKLVKAIFPINLADNGVEFSFFNEIEVNELGEKICSTYFTNPYKATDKAECERNHELIRYYIPKGKSMDSLTQEKVDEMFSHINSYVRKSKGIRHHMI